jgi:glycosyltransferase involved in cell wall biosynthesis
MPQSKAQKPVKILLACSGIGRVSRGFEVSFGQLYDQLRQNDKYTVYLAQGAKSKQDPRRICPLYFSNASWVASFLKKLPLFRNYSTEELSYSLGLLPFLLFHRIDVIMYSQSWLGIGLFHIRRWFGFRYKLLFSNGAPFGPQAYQGRCDFVQQKIPWVYDEARDLGFPESRMAVVPNGFHLEGNAPANLNERPASKQLLGIPRDKRVILSVAALNRHHKRIDYLIREATPLLLDGTHILLCLGQEEAETQGLRLEFSGLLQQGCLIFKKVRPEEVAAYYRAANVYVSGSLYEGFGRGVVEALSHGLPCLLHDHPGFKTLAGQYARYIDMSEAGALTKALREESVRVHTFEDATAISRYVFDRYDWHNVTPQYEALFQKCLEMEMI